MKLIFTMSLLFVLLFASAFSYASDIQSPAMADQIVIVSCSNPEFVTESSTLLILAVRSLDGKKSL